MPGFHFYHPIEVRYGDLDPQGHVNNAKYFTYLEQARIAYVKNLGLWDGRSFLDVGFILADIHLTFKKPILFGQKVRVGVSIIQLGNKSMTTVYCMEEIGNEQIYATGKSILVTYDYYKQETIPIPSHWREAILSFEGITANA